MTIVILIVTVAALVAVGAIVALIIVAGFGTSLLLWFHYEDKHDSGVELKK